MLPSPYRQGGQNYSYLYDGKGNVTALLDSSQSVAATYTYDAFGNLMSQAGSLFQPFKFSTKYYDEGTGLSYFGYRFYLPVLGRWMTRDPIGYEGGLNLYGFVGNNPTNYLDPFGHEYNPYFDYDPAGQAVGNAMRDVAGAVTYMMKPVDAIMDSPLWYSPYLPGERDILLYPEEFQDFVFSVVDTILMGATAGMDPTISTVPLPKVPPRVPCRTQG
jgi:RHS repeat-associated protein